MTLRLLLIPLAIALLAAIAACGGDDDTSSTTPGSGSPSAATDGVGTVADDIYFTNLSSTLEDLVPESSALDEFRATAFDPALSEAERAANAEEFADRYESYTTTAHDDVLAITPGESLAGEHGALVDALADLITLGEELAAALEGAPVSTEAEFGDLFFELEGQSLELRVRDACFRLQQVANNAGIETGFVCPR